MFSLHIHDIFFLYCFILFFKKKGFSFFFVQHSDIYIYIYIKWWSKMNQFYSFPLDHLLYAVFPMYQLCPMVVIWMNNWEPFDFDAYNGFSEVFINSLKLEIEIHNFWESFIAISLLKWVKRVVKTKTYNTVWKSLKVTYKGYWNLGSVSAAINLWHK